MLVVSFISIPWTMNKILQNLLRIIRRFPLAILVVIFMKPVLCECEEDKLFRQIWEKLEKLKQEYHSCQGMITEIRDSPLFQEPVQFEGKFYVKNPDRFCLEYSKPEIVQIIFNKDYVNITLMDDMLKTEVFNAKNQVKRARNYFSGKDSYENLTRDFIVSVTEYPKDYEIRMLPQGRRIKKKINYILIWLDKESYYLKKLEVEGKNGVKSIYIIDSIKVNSNLDEKTFQIYRP